MHSAAAEDSPALEKTEERRAPRIFFAIFHIFVDTIQNFRFASKTRVVTSLLEIRVARTTHNMPKTKTVHSESYKKQS